MLDIITPLFPEYTLHLPQNIIGLVIWVTWFLFLMGISIRLKDHRFSFNRRNLLWLALLSTAILIMTPFIGVPIGDHASVIEKARPFYHMMFLAAVPWMIASGVLGMMPAVILASVSGLLLAYLDSHNLFTPLIWMTLALFFSWAINQRYRTAFYRILRFPLTGAVVSLVIIYPFVFLAQIISLQGSFPARMNAGVPILLPSLIALGGMVLVAGVISTLVKFLFPSQWVGHKTLDRSPGEKSLKLRWIGVILPLLLVIWLGAVVISWRVFGQQNRSVLEDQLTRTASLVEQDLHGFINNGKKILTKEAQNPALSSKAQEELIPIFTEEADSLEYFDRILLLDASGELLGAYPLVSPDAFSYPSSEEGILRMIPGIGRNNIWITTVKSEDGTNKILFLARLPEGSVFDGRILWAEVDYLTNDLTKTNRQILAVFAQNQGIGQIIGRDGEIMYSTQPQQSLEGRTSPIDVAIDGDESLLQYAQPIPGTDLSLLLSYPLNLLYEMNLKAVLPVVLGGGALVLAASLVTLIGWYSIEKSIRQWQKLARQVASGDFAVDLSKSQTGGAISAFNDDLRTMVGTIEKRSHQQKELFSLNLETAAIDNLEESLNVILKAALTHGVSSVRLVLMDQIDDGQQAQVSKRFGMGKHHRHFAGLDDEILSRVQSEGLVVYRNFQLGKAVNLAKGTPYPASMIALPVKLQGQTGGALWVTYQGLRSPDENEVLFFESLAQKASQVISRSHLVSKIAQTKSYLEFLMDMVPASVLILRDDGSIAYQNKRANILLGELENLTMEDVAKRLEIPDFADLLHHDQEKGDKKEIKLTNGKIYQLMSHPVKINGQEDGKAVILTDITQQVEREARKSEYVTTVSHELRSPLTLIQGYAKILRLTGNLNEQQDDYIGNIIENVEEMKSLVQNLLDIGRLETGDPLEISTFAADDLIQKVADSMMVQARQKNIQLMVNKPEQPHMIAADLTFVTQALKNLVDNGIKFTKMGGEVTIALSATETDVIFSIEDNGIGISPLDQRHLFEKFQRVIPSTGETHVGGGLGLAIVKTIAEHHGGKVWLESQLGKGSTFYISIPQPPINSRS